MREYSALISLADTLTGGLRVLACLIITGPEFHKKKHTAE